MARFVGAFAILLTLFFAFSRTDYFIATLSPASISLNAAVAAAVLAAFGERAVAAGDAVYTPRLELTIGNACDAAEPLGLYAAAVLGSPVPLLLRALGLLGGATLILLVNQLRIVTLYYTGVYWPTAFDPMHTEVWQGLFILLGVTIWLLWASWTLRITSARG